ncbi:fimbria/pilus outer membrane usher protein [Erwinia sp. BC051422]|uniref:fimbria/pilus outer membrane usher protein n=1 Tax=Erwinia wuhanensis TaxID=3045167 RepID=UPI00264A9C09|nr:fimbria/pilus outer membrane usher protein [Erwinia sp. BC051422]MDN8541614.1 fimbria/pilus outer membrane usher protein [Erwinia sp. BC051422]
MENASPQGKRWKQAQLVLLLPFISSAYAIEPSPSAPQEVAKNVEFDPTFLNVSDGSAIDLGRFANGAAALPGIYRTAVYVNNDLLGNYDIEFSADKNKNVLPCLKEELIKRIAFDAGRIPANFFEQDERGRGCYDLKKKIPEIAVNYDSNEQRLDIIVPQIYMARNARGAISKDRWDSGIPAALLAYNASAYTSESGGTRYQSVYASIRAGLNIASWYLRHNGSWNWVEHGQKKYSALNTYVQRDIPALESRLLAGQANTSGLLFETLPFSGVQLASDERMLPNSLRGYAPEIHGVARTNARVTVRQGSQVIYETTVPPGEFLINDLYPTGYGGNLAVTVRESDGSEQYFEVPYSSVAQLLRPGNSRYSVTAGRLRSSSLSEKPALYQATLQYGLTNMLTAYGGFQASQNYYALQSGLALGTEIGAFALDATQARTYLGGTAEDTTTSMSGQSFQLSYSKTVSATSSKVSLAAYRFSTSGYMGFMTAMQTREAVADGLSTSAIWRAKNRFIATVSQGLPERWGTLYASSSLQDYWNREGNSKQYQLGYNNRYKNLSWGLSVNRTWTLYGEAENNYLLNFSLPLGNSSSYTPQLRVDLAHNSNGRTSEQAAISGTGGKLGQFSYGVSAANANQGTGSSGTVNGTWRSAVSSLSASYGKGSNYYSASGGMSGTVIGHSGGVTLTPYTSDTFALVEAKGAQGASVSSYPGVHVDWNGYAAVPYLDPYQLNEVTLDPGGAASDVELDTTSLKVAPLSGAVVKLKYGTRSGTAVLIAATFQGEPVAFGAEVLDSKGNHVGTVGQGGEVYARVQAQRDKLRVKWGDAPDMQCSLSYILMPQAETDRQREIPRFESVCEAIEKTAQPEGTMAEAPPTSRQSHS